MLLRLWHTGVDPARWAEYARFEREHSLPMFRQQVGCQGVLFLRTPDGAGAVACTFWVDRRAIESLDDSASYKATVARILAAGFLRGPQRVEVFEVAGGALDPLPALASFVRS